MSGPDAGSCDAVRAVLFLLVLFYMRCNVLIDVCSRTSQVCSCGDSSESVVTRVSHIETIYLIMGRHRPLTLPPSNLVSAVLLLTLSGDIESNPGPRKAKFPCGICSKPVKASDPAVCCDQCNFWIHNRCSGLSPYMYECLKTVVVYGYAHLVACRLSRHRFSTHLISAHRTVSVH